MKTQSNYLRNAKFRMENKKWLKYSSNISLRIIAALEENKNMTQKALAEIIGVSPQYINKILRGQENLSLSTIAKISDALGVELISFPKFSFDKTDDFRNKKNVEYILGAVRQLDKISSKKICK
jgi:transcriptional regulator with XRE-family HTH domain